MNEWINNEVGADKSVTTIQINNLNCTQFKQIWSILTAKTKHSYGCPTDLEVYSMSQWMGVSVMSTLSNSTYIDAIARLSLSQNTSWWQDSKLFSHLLSFLSKQS